MREFENAEKADESQFSACEHVKRYESQEISANEYARQHGIKRSTFYGWRQRHGARKEVESGKFIEVTVGSKVAVEKRFVEVEFSGGIKIKVGRDSDVWVLKKLKEAYGI